MGTAPETNAAAGVMLTVAEAAALRGCTEQHVRRLINGGELPAVSSRSEANGQKLHLIPLAALPRKLRLKYMLSDRRDAPVPEQFAAQAELLYSEYTEAQRAQVALWADIIEDWISCRSKWKGYKYEADQLYVGKCRLEHPEVQISEEILYARWIAYCRRDINALIDKRGGWNRGSSSIPDPVWDYFLYLFLGVDGDRQLPITQLYALTRSWTQEFYPEYFGALPHERSFRRRLETIETPAAALGRGGKKSFDDRYGPYIERMYEELRVNDYWVADNHTWDIISRADDGERTHRLYITAFLDARSQVITGWNITDAPSAQSTLLALRHGIMRHGVPRKILVDNGSEFLTHDVGGRGHRRRKSQAQQLEPPTVFARLGVEMRNAIVRNAKAKPIERTFDTLKNTLSRSFPTFTGGNILEKPESLKYRLKKGEIPLDGQLRDWLGDMIDGIYNVGAYGGKVGADRGRRRIDIWNAGAAETGIRRPVSDTDLDLLLARSTRKQKVGRMGVCVSIAGEKLQYWDTDTWQLQDREVYVRYDPADLREARVYDADTDRYLRTIPLSQATLLLFDASREDVAIAQEQIRRAKRNVRDKLIEYTTRLPAEQRIDILDMQLRRARAGKTGYVVADPKIIVPVYASKYEQPEAEYKRAVGDGVGVVIDLDRMNAAAEARRGNNGK